MTRFKVLSTALLICGLLIALPSLAEVPEVSARPAAAQVPGECADTTTPSIETPSIDILSSEDPLQTPAQDPAEDLESHIDPSRDLLDKKIEACDPDTQPCPPGCFCLIVRNQVNCYC